MRKFAYPLEALLRLKRQRERSAELKLAGARAALEQARAHASTLHQRLETQAAAAARRTQTVVPAREWAAAADHTNRLLAALAAAEQAVERAAAEFEAIRRERVRFATEAESLATLRERRLDDHRRLVAHETQVHLDDLILQRRHAQLKPTGGAP